METLLQEDSLLMSMTVAVHPLTWSTPRMMGLLAVVLMELEG